MGCYSKFARCCAVVVDVFPKIMQEILATRIQGADLYDTVMNHTDFKKRLSGDEINTIQTLLTDGFSKFNVTLIYKIAKFFNFIPSPTQNWGANPFANEMEIGDDVERIRQTRKHLVHRIDCEIGDLEFHTIFSDLEQLGNRVDVYLKKSNDFGFQKDIEYRKTITIDDCQENEYIEAIKEAEDLRVMNFPSKESKHLSIYMNAVGKSLQCVKLMQNTAKRDKEITEILCGVLGTAKEASVGSFAEGLTGFCSDVDMIMFADTFKVSDSKDKLYNLEFMHFRLNRVPDEGHPGYAKLCVIWVNSKFLKDDVYKYTYTDLKDDKVYLKNNVKELLHGSEGSTGFIIHGPAYNCQLNQQRIESIFNEDHKDLFKVGRGVGSDLVFCLKSKQWPVEASEWTTRRRASNWPTQKLLDHIINSGYLLAGVGSKESEESEIQWRVSFNEAELLIIESLNETQIHCIMLLKFLKETYLSNIAGKNITSYTMKTVMFWCLEEKSDEYWQSSNLVSCFCFCVSKLKSFVERGFLPNYFIRKRNLFVAEEFACDKITKTREYLEGFLKNPKAVISLMLPSYQDNATQPQICSLRIMSKITFIQKWLYYIVIRAMQYELHFVHRLIDLYYGYNIQYSLKRCSKALEKLNAFGKSKPLIKKLMNYMGVLQYILLMKEKNPREHRKNSDSRQKYSEYMKQSATGDLTHTSLRMATCYLDEGVKEECLNIIRTVTDLGEDFFMQNFLERLKQALFCDLKAFRKKQHNDHEINLYMHIINDIDFIFQDPYKTADEFAYFKERGYMLIGNDSLTLAWKGSYFDVTFMLAELPVLPKPAALELCVDISHKYVRFHPFFYGLLLEFLWHQKYNSENDEKKSVLRKMIHCVFKFSVEHRSRGLNFITYCCVLCKDCCSAVRFLLQSLALNPVKQNVSYLYIKYILTLLRLALSDDTNDRNLWLNLLEIKWNID